MTPVDDRSRPDPVADPSADPSSGSRSQDTRARRARAGWWIAVPGIVLMLVVLVAMVLWRLRPRLTDQEVDGIVTAAIQQEAKAAFLVTGYLDISSQAHVENTMRLLPGLLNLPVGTTIVNVRAPGRAHYGFEVSQITPDRITLMKDGVVEVRVPQPVVFSVSPDLDKLEIETTVGWTRMGGDSREKVQSRALGMLQDNMKQQAVQHMRTSQQPDINSADALYSLLRPVLIAAGLKDPHFRFIIGRNLVMEPHAQ